MLTPVHMLVYTFGAFRENEVLIFYCAGGKIGEVAGEFLAEEHSPDAGSEAPDAVSERPVCRLPGPARVRHRTIGTRRWLERPVVRVRCAGVLATLSAHESCEHRTLRVRPVASVR